MKVNMENKEQNSEENDLKSFMKEFDALISKYPKLSMMLFCGDMDKNLATVVGKGKSEDVKSLLCSTIASAVPVAELIIDAYNIVVIESMMGVDEEFVDALKSFKIMTVGVIAEMAMERKAIMCHKGDMLEKLAELEEMAKEEENKPHIPMSILRGPIGEA